MIRGIIFDCFGVLYGGSLNVLAAMAPEHQAQAVRDVNTAKDYGYISYKEHVDQISEIIGKTADEVLAIVGERQVINNDLMAYAHRLKDTCKVGLLSNTGDHVVEALFGDEASRLFDAVVLSYKEGIIKPDPEIFKLAAERLGLLSEECIMIDDIEANCDGARLAGMQAVLHVSNEATQHQVNNLIGMA